MVAGLSTIEAWVLPIKSLDTNSFEIEYSICSTKSPNKEACFKLSLMAAKLTSFLKFKFKHVIPIFYTYFINFLKKNFSLKIKI